MVGCGVGSGDGFQPSVDAWDRSAEALRHSKVLAECSSAWTDKSVRPYIVKGKVKGGDRACPVLPEP
jgi:hypothetical protein